MEKKVWGVVSGRITSPTPSLDEYALSLMQEQAAGIIWGGLEDSQKALVKEFMDRPKLMWDTLKDHHQQQNSTSRFLAYEQLFSISKRDDESLVALCSRISASLSGIMDATPVGFTLDLLYNDLACMALIKALPPDQYSSFRSVGVCALSRLSSPSISLSFWLSLYVL